MLDEYYKFKILDKAKNKYFFIEVNYSDDEEVNQCKILRFTFPNGDVAFVDKKHLTELLFAIGNPQEQQKMIPQKITKVRHYEGNMYVQIKKDNLRRGDILKVPYTISLPSVSEEVIAGLKPQIQRGIIPKVDKLILPSLSKSMMRAVKENK